MQVLVIHGAGGFINVDRADFVAGLRARKVTLEDLRRSGGDWKSNLQRDLGPEYDVLQPRMPDADAPQYAAWAAWFEQILPLLDSEVILVGHSLGALFLAKYLSENKIANKVHSLHLCAAPYTGVEAHVMLQGRLRTAGWLVDNDFALLAEQCGAVYLSTTALTTLRCRSQQRKVTHSTYRRRWCAPLATSGTSVASRYQELLTI